MKFNSKSLIIDWFEYRLLYRTHQIQKSTSFYTISWVFLADKLKIGIPINF